MAPFSERQSDVCEARGFAATDQDLASSLGEILKDQS
jgi:hypothetical protein